MKAIALTEQYWHGLSKRSAALGVWEVCRCWKRWKQIYQVRDDSRNQAPNGFRVCRMGLEGYNCRDFAFFHQRMGYSQFRQLNNMLSMKIQCLSRLFLIVATASAIASVSTTVKAQSTVKPQPTIKTQPAAKTQPAIHGIASWYGPGFSGNRTASGEVFNPKDLTAAHHSLPFGTQVRVTNLKNGQAVVVRINDRLGDPDVMIDLSSGAAQSIRMTENSLVRMEILGR